MGKLISYVPPSRPIVPRPEVKQDPPSPPPPPAPIYLPVDVRAAVWCGKLLHWWGRILIWCAKIIYTNSYRGHKFIAAHLFGPVGIRRMNLRMASCYSCRHRSLRKVKGKSFEECGAEHCGCGEHRLANLRHKRRLSGYRCVLGRFEYGILASAWYRIFPLPPSKTKQEN